MIVLLVAAAAFSGGFLRWALSRWGSLAPNSLACFMAGVFLSVPLSTVTAAVLITGFCGSLSTWSTLSRELGTMIKEHDWARLLIYGSSTLALGVSLIWLGGKAVTLATHLST